MVKENDIYITRRLYWELRKIILWLSLHVPLSYMKYSGRIDSLKILLFHDLSHTYYHVEQRVKCRFQLSSFDLTLRWIVARCTYMLCNVTLLPSFSGNCFHHASCCISLFLWKLITGKLVNSEINQCSCKKKKKTIVALLSLHCVFFGNACNKQHNFSEPNHL